MANERRATPVPATTLQILAGDILATRVMELLEQLAFAGTWEPGVKLKDALEVYQQVRLGTTIKDAQDPQKMTVHEWAPAPITERSRVHS